MLSASVLSIQLYYSLISIESRLVDQFEGNRFQNHNNIKPIERVKFEGFLTVFNAIHTNYTHTKQGNLIILRLSCVFSHFLSDILSKR